MSHRALALRGALALLAGSSFVLPQPPAQAVELIQIRLPVLGDTLSARVSELQSPDALWAGTSDLAELNRATDGSFAASIQVLMNHPLPDSDYHSSPMVQQVEVLLKQLIEIDAGQKQILETEPVYEALLRLKASKRSLTLLNLLGELPGDRVTIRLDRAVPFLRRLDRHNTYIKRLMGQYPTLPAAPVTALLPGPYPIQIRTITLPAAANHEALEVTLVRPTAAPTLAPVVISHGLWDSPTSFLGWAKHLASHGAPVFLPRHPGSDISQQAEMLAGKVPPPNPREFLRRPNDVRFVLDALEAGRLPGAEGIQARSVTFIGHSWGGTTALQLAGARSLRSPLWDSCSNIDNHHRNISWVLQCSFLPAATDASLADPRIVRVAAVSPPQGLVFAAGLVDLKVPVLLVSGSDDFVVPTQPEAIVPLGQYPKGSNQLVLADGGTHFNLPANATSNGGPLRALLLSWVRGLPIHPGSAVADPKGLPLHLIPQAVRQP